MKYSRLNNKTKLTIVLVLVLVFTIVSFIIVYKKLNLFYIIKNTYKEKIVVYDNKIINYNNYNNNIKKLFELKDMENLKLIKIENLSNLILKLSMKLDLYNLKEENINIGYKEFIDEYKNNNIFKVYVKISCAGNYEDLIDYVEYIRNCSKFIILDNIELNTIDSTIDQEFKLDLNLSIYTLSEKENEQ